MKVRKGFVTNSSSTNFGTMLVTSLGSMGIASILNIFNIDINAKQKSYVRLVVEAPKNKILKPGDAIALRGQVIKVDIIDGKISEAPTVVAEANIDCIDGVSVIDSDGKSFYVTTEAKRVEDYKGSIRFEVSAEYEGERMSANVDFYLAAFTVDPPGGIFVAKMKTEQKVKLKSNIGTTFSNDVDPSILKVEILKDDTTTQELNLIENIEEPEKFFNKFTCIVDKRFNMKAEIGDAVIERPYSARLLNECILVPKQLREPIIIKCYTEQDRDKRTETAFELPIKVLIYDKDKNNLVTDINLTNSLEFEFYPKSGHRHLTNEQARKALEDARLAAELVPNTGAATESKNYAKYRIYADALAEAETDSIDIGISISCGGQNIDEIELKGQLKPRIDIKGLIKQFIDYPKGTFIGSLITLGDIDTYINALDYVSEIKVTSKGNPKYEPGENMMYLNRIPEGIHEFKEVQTIHHEIAHVIEEQHKDSEGTEEWNERHAYFIQYLSDAAHEFSGMERGQTTDFSAAVVNGINAFALAFFNFANAVQPPNRGEIISWFGSKTLTQHEVFDKYLDLNIHASGFNIPEDIKDKIRKEVASTYFPGNIMGKWKEDGGPFNGMEFRISWVDGRLNKITPVSRGYTFKELSRRWLGGGLLKLEVKYFVTRLSDNDEDEVTAVFDGGTFDPSDYHYPAINNMTIKWKPDRGFSDSVLGSYIDKEIPLNRI